ncbi:RING-type domain-containing protein [Caenorhabditis elegans]|uniref:RING-type domain-containing protein n=1 Tax=Caenorhabditis elegans TaxID=6239 RepID=Q8WQC5_CAEEL|nr:RING-type domain-containing protein [Caenorhabditis elegans]CAD01083.1 RING-type domain-containing protein [Caenorhabditis elegans]|eukprot:NP_492632.1 Uncharacterized protein CELE_T24D1.5 [Caenorhabditis elegans]
MDPMRGSRQHRIKGFPEVDVEEQRRAFRRYEQQMEDYELARRIQEQENRQNEGERPDFPNGGGNWDLDSDNDDEEMMDEEEEEFSDDATYSAPRETDRIDNRNASQHVRVPTSHRSVFFNVEEDVDSEMSDEDEEDDEEEENYHRAHEGHQIASRIRREPISRVVFSDDEEDSEITDEDEEESEFRRSNLVTGGPRRLHFHTDEEEDDSDMDDEDEEESDDSNSPNSAAAVASHTGPTLRRSNNSRSSGFRPESDSIIWDSDSEYDDEEDSIDSPIGSTETRSLQNGVQNRFTTSFDRRSSNDEDDEENSFDSEISDSYMSYSDGPGTSMPIRPIRTGTPDGTWGDCTMCFEVPIEPQGCNRCQQIIGCSACIVHWHHHALSPSCPLCRRRWSRQPDVSNMNVISQRSTIAHRRF